MIDGLCTRRRRRSANRLLEIEHELGSEAEFISPFLHDCPVA